MISIATTQNFGNPIVQGTGDKSNPNQSRAMNAFPNAFIALLWTRKIRVANELNEVWGPSIHLKLRHLPLASARQLVNENFNLDLVWKFSSQFWFIFVSNCLYKIFCCLHHQNLSDKQHFEDLKCSLKVDPDHWLILGIEIVKTRKTRFFKTKID